MRAAVVVDGGGFAVEDVADPEPGAGELLLRVSACGLCGSDLKARGAFPVGSILGHEFGGEVVGVGAGVDPAGWHDGMTAAVLPVASCGTCAWCVAGDVVHCASAQLIGLGGGAGGFAELVTVPAASSFAVPDSIERTHAALVEPYAVGLHTADAGSIAEGDDVLVIGAGTVGLTTMAWARARGAASITAVDPVADRRANSARFGGTATLAGIDEVEHGAYDVVVECVGKGGLLDASVNAARPKGRIVIAGVCLDHDPFFQATALMKEVSVHFAVYYAPADFRSVVVALEAGTIEAAPLVGETRPLVELDAAFDALAASTTTGKILIAPNV